jgi:hypothetical protein
VAQCLDHLATSNRVYLDAMRPPAARARQERRLRSGPAQAGFFGGLFARSLEPPARPAFKLKAPSRIKPQPSPRLADALAAFVASQQGVVAFLRETAALDLTHEMFPPPSSAASASASRRASTCSRPMAVGTCGKPGTCATPPSRHR